MATDLFDVWEVLYEIMCIPCENHDYCHGDDDEANDQQMILCMIADQIVRVDEQKIKKDDICDPLGADDTEEN